LGNISTTWSVVGTGDFDGDGKADILWHDTSGNVPIWFMNGTTISSGALLGNIPATWSIVGTGDFNGDGKSDILWRDTSGNVAVWLILLHHKFRRLFGGRRRAQHWHLRRVVAIATANRRWIVAIELGTWRCGRIGGAAGSITTGNGRFFRSERRNVVLRGE